ncbi:MAG: hypothetical protein ACTSX6_04610 [Candidatus Heimdallarchaeaceae archaeon]
MEFTREELKEIEKVFDIAAGNLTRHHAEILAKIGLVMKDSKLLDKYLTKLLVENINTFGIYRTISAKANKMQGNNSEEW